VAHKVQEIPVLGYFFSYTVHVSTCAVYIVSFPLPSVQKIIMTGNRSSSHGSNTLQNKANYQH
jgi:hypothetical protein